MGLRGTLITPLDVASASGMNAQPGGAGTAYSSSGAAMARTDDALISVVLSAVNRRSAMHNAKLARMTDAVQRGSYRVSATATSRAIVEDALVWSRLA